MKQQTQFGVIKLHFSRKEKAFACSLDGVVYAGSRIKGQETYIARVAKEHAQETILEARARIQPFA